jgi:hypothetical protein
MSETLNFLGGETPAEPEVVAAEAAAPIPAEAPSPPAAEPPQPPADPGHVPISALLDEREKRQAERARAEILERQLQDMRAALQPPRDLEPNAAMEMALYNQNLRASRKFAEREYGKSQIQEIHDWAAARCDADPMFNQQMRSSEDPYEAAYQAYNREQILRTVKPDDLAAFKAWRQAQAQAATHSSATHPSATPAAVPRSLATASGTGGAGQPHVPVGAGQAFGAAFSR